MSDWQTAIPLAMSSCISSYRAMFQNGFVINPSSAAWPAANRAYFIPFRIARPLVAYKMVFGCGSLAGGNCDMGVFDLGGNKLFSSGAVARSASNEVIVDITDAVIPAGSYYMGMSHDGTSNVVSMAGGLQVAKLGGVLSMSTAYTLPDPVTYAALADNFVPSFAIYTRPY